MTNNKRTWAVGLAACYGFFVFLAHLPTMSEPADALDGLLVIVLTLPWSLIMVFVLDAIDPTLIDNPTVSFVGLLVGATINGVIIFFATSRIAGEVLERKNQSKA